MEIESTKTKLPDEMVSANEAGPDERVTAPETQARVVGTKFTTFFSG